jgi:CBS domain containing-hemolysin-like protein
VPLERQMLKNLLHFSERCRRRRHSAWRDHRSPSTASFAELVAAFAEHGHSRLPVYGRSLDEVIGMVHIKDVFPIVADMALKGRAGPTDWSKLMRQPLFVPQARGALDVLATCGRAARTWPW